jgi:hypothetical protein
MLGGCHPGLIAWAITCSPNRDFSYIELEHPIKKEDLFTLVEQIVRSTHLNDKIYVLEKEKRLYIELHQPGRLRFWSHINLNKNGKHIYINSKGDKLGCGDHPQLEIIHRNLVDRILQEVPKIYLIDSPSRPLS